MSEKILLDTDVLLDVALRREEFFENSRFVLDWAESHPGTCAVSWHSFSNIAYIFGPSSDCKAFLTELLRFIKVPTCGTSAMLVALNLEMADIEDAMQASSALTFGASHIVTRNLKDFRKSPVPSITPVKFREHVSASK